MDMITEQEIKVAPMRMASWTASGPDALPVVMWQQVWPTVKQWVVDVFQASLRFSYFPSAWKIHDAWREGKILSLVSFDVKGAYNASAPASITVNMYQSEELAIEHAGLPQGSPLSPILFLFLNANLVDVFITRRKGAIVFVDDYTRWTVGLSAEANTTIFQEKVIPRALEWAAQSGAAFEAEKISFIYLTRNQRYRQLPAVPLHVNGATVTPASEVKIPRRDTRPGFTVQITHRKGSRQLFIPTVASKIGYAASVWCPIRPNSIMAAGIGRPFEAIQRVASQAIVGVFRNAAIVIAEAELFTSVSVRNSLVGTGLVARVNQADIVSSNRTVGNDALNAHFTQLGVILEAISFVATMLPRIRMSPWKIHVKIVVNNPAVLLSLAQPHLQGGQALVTRITEAISQLLETGVRVSLKPPIAEDHESTTRAHTLARAATEAHNEVNPRPGRKSSFGHQRYDGLGRMLNITGGITSSVRPLASYTLAGFCSPRTPYEDTV
ncbi:uncharacterized protein KD926_001223 [Aspergillus affinis]|uniref:uncharacterized protein n=1 Tax=Aspergillus affinis TaxID=1070780 RepID=UPI0022FE44FC|nr:uncharacterized protein KD926_001223 [Aspergillus affinis]KAI9036908.1 hypothetical protein KD926_001223 [Aspergillus affinis]